MARAFDPRITPARPDLAASHLRGRVEAARFVEGTRMQVAEPAAPLRRAPAPDAALDTEALFGERVTVYESTDEGWCWGQLECDGYVGWLPANALVAEGKVATHRVSALRSFVFPKPDIKAPPLRALSFGSLLVVAGEQESFVVAEDGGFVPPQHVVAADFREDDAVAVARRFLGTPYLWGGRSSLGLDCSGLVQLALQSAGIEAPRDSDMQQALGKSVGFGGDIAALKRGDLIFWKGHVGFTTGDNTLLHANAHHMAVAEEPLQEAITRIRAAGLEVLDVRRL